MRGRVVGVIVYSRPIFQAGGFRIFFNTEWYLSERFNHVLRIQRVVVHPSFRGIGVARKLLTETLPRLNIPFVEILSSMERLIPFTHGLMQHVAVETAPEKEEKCKEFRQIFGIDLRRRGAIEVFEYVRRTGGLRRLLKWLKENLHIFTQGKTEKVGRENAARMLRLVKSSASPKVYGLWINPDPKFAEIRKKALRDA